MLFNGLIAIHDDYYNNGNNDKSIQLQEPKQRLIGDMRPHNNIVCVDLDMLFFFLNLDDRR
jgi:hypothetical protein